MKKGIATVWATGNNMRLFQMWHGNPMAKNGRRTWWSQNALSSVQRQVFQLHDLAGQLWQRNIHCGGFLYTTKRCSAVKSRASWFFAVIVLSIAKRERKKCLISKDFWVVGLFPFDGAGGFRRSVLRFFAVQRLKWDLPNQPGASACNHLYTYYHLNPFVKNDFCASHLNIIYSFSLGCQSGSWRNKTRWFTVGLSVWRYCVFVDV